MDDLVTGRRPLLLAWLGLGLGCDDPAGVERDGVIIGSVVLGSVNGVVMAAAVTAP